MVGRVQRAGRGVAPVVAALAGLDNTSSQVGWFETSKYPDGTPTAYVAAINEFGTSRTPARPFMRPAIATYGPEWLKLMGAAAVQVATGAITGAAAMDMIAARAAGDVGKAIQSVTSPPLAASTVARKGFDKPLIDTGLMFQSVTHRTVAK